MGDTLAKIPFMQTDEMGCVESVKNPALLNGERQLLLIRQSPGAKLMGTERVKLPQPERESDTLMDIFIQI